MITATIKSSAVTSTRTIPGSTPIAATDKRINLRRQSGSPTSGNPTFSSPTIAAVTLLRSRKSGSPTHHGRTCAVLITRGPCRQPRFPRRFLELIKRLRHNGSRTFKDRRLYSEATQEAAERVAAPAPSIRAQPASAAMKAASSRTRLRHSRLPGNRLPIRSTASRINHVAGGGNETARKEQKEEL
jgi:hypothetical protein